MRVIFRRILTPQSSLYSALFLRYERRKFAYFLYLLKYSTIFVNGIVETKEKSLRTRYPNFDSADRRIFSALQDLREQNSIYEEEDTRSQRKQRPINAKATQV